jgi:hypothetical protein
MKVTKTVRTEYVLDEPNKKVSPALVAGWIQKLEKAGVDMEGGEFTTETDQYGTIRGNLTVIKTTYYDDSTLARMEK